MTPINNSSFTTSSPQPQVPSTAPKPRFSFFPGRGVSATPTVEKKETEEGAAKSFFGRFSVGSSASSAPKLSSLEENDAELDPSAFDSLALLETLKPVTLSEPIPIPRSSKFGTNRYESDENLIATPFEAVRDHIQKRYPNFDITAYNSCQDLHNLGHPLHFALAHEDYRLANLLIEAGADINQLDPQKNTISLLAAQNLFKKTEKDPIKNTLTFLKKMSDKDVSGQFWQKNSQGVCCVDLLICFYEQNKLPDDEKIHAKRKLAVILSKAQTHLDAENLTEYKKTATKLLQSLPDIEHLLSIGLDIDTCSDQGYSTLSIALRNRDFTKVKKLIKQGADPFKVAGKNSPHQMALLEKERLERLIFNLASSPEKKESPERFQNLLTLGVSAVGVRVFKSDHPEVQQMMERFRTEKVQAVFHGRSHVEIQQNEKQTLMSESSPGSEGTSPALRTALSEAEDKLIEILGIISLFNSRATSTGD